MDVYQRYCRLYVDDLTRRKKYRKAIKKGGKRFDNTKWVLDSIKLEFDFGSPKTANEMIKTYITQKLQIKTMTLTESFEQNFMMLTDMVAGAESLKPSLSKISFFLECSYF